MLMIRRMTRGIFQDQSLSAVEAFDMKRKITVSMTITGYALL
jgi:hypothetical protein